MTFDELLDVIDGTIMDVYCTTETDYHKTLWFGLDCNFTYDEVEVPIADMEVVRVWATVSDDDEYGVLRICVDVPPETWEKPKRRALADEVRERMAAERDERVDGLTKMQRDAVLMAIDKAADDGNHFAFYPAFNDHSAYANEAQEVVLAEMEANGFTVTQFYGKTIISW